ncbi:MAG: methyltransferase domain-containing protein [Candidatus Pacebacteria bacterium]|nr:methyltransferase domain-containing protein [Candidatus Paceibacterota bacterium]
MDQTFLKITFLPGLKSVVLDEVTRYPELHIIEQGDEEIYLEATLQFETILNLKSIINVYLVKRDAKLNPHYLSNHKSILGNLIEIVLKDRNKLFKSFTLSCAGSDSKEVGEIQNFIATTYKLLPDEEADMKIYIGKSDDVWEIGVCLTPRPLSLREYKIANLKGALNPTIAYVMNTFCNLASAQSYLNICSGSGTLLIEAAQSGFAGKLFGFDIDGKHNALAVQNIKKAGFIKSIQLKTADILENPDLGTFDCITSDLPFGMLVSKDEDLQKLYETFVRYCEKVLDPEGRLVVYTTEHELLDKILQQSKFKIIEKLGLKLVTNVNSYLYPKIFVCEFK